MKSMLYGAGCWSLNSLPLTIVISARNFDLKNSQFGCDKKLQNRKGLGCQMKNDPRHEKTCLCHMRTTKTQISLRIRSLISTFVAACLDSISSFYIRNFKPLASLYGCGFSRDGSNGKNILALLSLRKFLSALLACNTIMTWSIWTDSVDPDPTAPVWYSVYIFFDIFSFSIAIFWDSSLENLSSGFPTK